MSKTWLFAVLAVSVTILCTTAVCQMSAGIIISSAVVTSIILIWLYASVIRQMRAVQNGLYLLQAQDFASRLAKVGDHDADRVVDLFNRLMQALKEERLKKEEQDRFLQQLIEASPMGIAICSLDGKPVTTNPAYHNLLNDALVKEISLLQPGETKSVRTNGSEIFRISRLWFMERGFQRPFILIEQLTDEIIKVEKQTYSKVIRTMAHEVNNTLGAISSVFETLLDMEYNEDINGTLEVCNNRCLNLSEFIRNYADVVKVPAPVLKAANLRSTVERILPIVREMASGTAEVSVEGESDTIMADDTLLQQAFINIMKNAVEAIAESGSQGEIKIKIKGSKILFENNGPDITPEVAEHLFSPFYTTKPRGQGLGLMLVSEVLRGHNADFSLTSANHRTTFSIKFK